MSSDRESWHSYPSRGVEFSDAWVSDSSTSILAELSCRIPRLTSAEELVRTDFFCSVVDDKLELPAARLCRANKCQNKVGMIVWYASTLEASFSIMIRIGSVYAVMCLCGVMI